MYPYAFSPLFFKHVIKLSVYSIALGQNKIELNTANPQVTTWNVGRDESCPVTINNPTVSVSHATIRFEDGVWFIKDNGSTNGTKVNGKRVVESECKSGDIISLGKLNCVFGVTQEVVAEAE